MIQKQDDVMNQSKYVYHGSPYSFNEFKPVNHYLVGKPGVFATTRIEQALCSLQYWNDDMFDQGTVNDDPVYFREKERNILEKTYKHKEGWLYVLLASSFVHEDNFMSTELISYSHPKIIKKIHIRDSLAAMNKSELLIFRYKDSKEFRKYIGQ